MVGIAIVGRPLARLLDDGYTAEITRVCTREESPKNTCSFLYGRCWRIWQQMGGKRMVTYTLQTESGSSLKGSGWKIVGKTNKGDWDRKGRERDWQMTSEYGKPYEYRVVPPCNPESSSELESCWCVYEIEDCVGACSLVQAPIGSGGC